MTQVFDRFSKHLALWVTLCGLGAALVILNACGKKAPPVAPHQAPLAAVTDLRGELSDGTATLKWTHAAENNRVSGYVVLRAQSALSRPDCPDCPLVFQKVDTMSVERSAHRQAQDLTFRQPVASGFRYTYNVRPYASSGDQGPDSNLVVIEFPAAEETAQ